MILEELPKKYLEHFKYEPKDIPDETGKTTSWLTGNTYQTYVKHHIDLDRNNNSDENLVWCHRMDHKQAHWQLHHHFIDKGIIPNHKSGNNKWYPPFRLFLTNLIRNGNIVFDRNEIEYIFVDV